MNKQLQKLVVQFQDYFNRFDNWSVRYSRTEKHTLPDTLAPVFIIGAPRTGSTFLLQQMLTCFKFVYISNLMALMPNQMLKLFTAFKKEILTYSDIKKSEFGYIKGLHAPNEAGQIFKKWFGNFSTEKERKLVESTISYLSIKANTPFICKNLYNSLRLQQIARIFPNSKFIHISRDPYFTAQSLLEARKKKYGDYSKWFSVQPEGYLNVVLEDPCYQVLWQIKSIEDSIFSFFNDMNYLNYYHIWYEDLCEDNSGQMEGLINHFNFKGITHESLNHYALSGNQIHSNKEVWQKLQTYYKELF